MTLTEQLEALVARTTAITMGTDTTTDASALSNESNHIWGDIGANAQEMLPIVRALFAKLSAELANAPASATAAFAQYLVDAAAAKFDRIDPPREVAAFLTLDSLESIARHCESKLAGA